MGKQIVKLSKYLSYLLRHHPEADGLTMDEHGWVWVDDLLAAAGMKRRGMTRALLVRVVAENDKQQFEFDEGEDRIRARQGHSRAVSLGWLPATPPELLYHGTSSRAVPSIRKEGLLRRKRQHVHLSVDAETARKVGARHGRPVILVIRAREMHERGFEFFFSPNGVWLTEGVPTGYIDFPG